jgi:hypothetical protein
VVVLRVISLAAAVCLVRVIRFYPWLGILRLHEEACVGHVSLCWLNFNPYAGCLGRIARSAFPRWWGLAASRTRVPAQQCAGGLLLRRRVGEHTTEPLSGFSFSV